MYMDSKCDGSLGCALVQGVQRYTSQLPRNTQSTRNHPAERLCRYMKLGRARRRARHERVTKRDRPDRFHYGTRTDTVRVGLVSSIFEETGNATTLGYTVLQLRQW